MNLIRRLLGRGGQNDPNLKLEHIFLFLENEAVAELLSISMVTKDLLAQLFPDTDLSDIQLSITSDPNLPPLKKLDRKGLLNGYKVGALFIAKTRRDLMQAMADGKAGYEMRDFDFEVPIFGVQKGIVVSIATKSKADVP